MALSTSPGDRSTSIFSSFIVIQSNREVCYFGYMRDSSYNAFLESSKIALKSSSSPMKKGTNDPLGKIVVIDDLDLH